ncbi:hypothetical protein EJ05DRAFT_477483, partial [Pseudovirgaria hyperparasitica]
MADPITAMEKSGSQSDLVHATSDVPKGSILDDGLSGNTAPLLPSPEIEPKSPALLSRTTSFSGISSYQDDVENTVFPPLERLTVFDFLENLALPSRLENLQTSVSNRAEKVRRVPLQRLKSTGLIAKDRIVDEWRRRVPPPEEQLSKYRKRVGQSVERLSKRWSDSKAVTWREKISFISGVLNVFISGYLVGALPEWFHLWYSAQILYFMPIRYYTYHKRGYHYFLVDLCYFVNLLLMLSIWVFPNSKRLFISTYCLAYGNNAVAIAMWRNSLVFHSLDKVTSLFIHIMPPVALHCIVHLIPKELQRTRFPAVHTILYSSPKSPEHYTLYQMMLWATLPYAVWQLSYHFFITVRRREKIQAGRPTSFTWLRKSYAPTMIGKFVLSLPEFLQEPAFMCIQYSYALLTMVPAPLWFWNRWASATFLFVVFVWSIYNGANYYIDVFGTRFQRELEQLKKDVAKWQASPEIKTPLMTPKADDDENKSQLGIAESQRFVSAEDGLGDTGASVTGGKPAIHKRVSSVDQIPLLDEKSSNGRLAESH